MEMKVGTDAAVCKSILLRHGVGNIKHLSARQLWFQGAVETYGIKVIKIPRAHNGSDLLTHGCSVSEMQSHLKNLRIDASAFTGYSKGGCRNVAY